MSNSNKYFPPYSTSHFENIKVELDLSDYATKKDLDDITQVDTSEFALKTNLSALKTEIDKLDIPKLSTVPTDLSKLTKKVHKEFIKKTNFNILKTKIDGVDDSKYALKTKYVGDLKLKVPDVTCLS